MEAVLVFGLIVGCVCGVIAANIAVGKGANGTGAFFIGLLLGPIGVLIACFMAPTQALPVAPAQPIRKKCPRCAEQVMAEALVCRYCRHEFEPPAPPVAPPVLAPVQPPEIEPAHYEAPSRYEPDSSRAVAVVLVIAAAIAVVVIIYISTPRAPDPVWNDTWSNVAADNGMKPRRTR